MEDILNSIEFIVSQFEYGWMEKYIVFDEIVEVKTDFSTEIELDNYYYSEKGDLSSSNGVISINEGTATLKYDSWEKGQRLIDNLKAIYFCKKTKKKNKKHKKRNKHDPQKKEEVEEKEEVEAENEYYSEFFTASILFLSLVIRILE